MKLNIGDKAPVFHGKDQDGNEVNLEDFLGKKVVLYFYPKDDTPGCTAEACNLRDNYDRFLAQGYEVLGVSGDDEASHRAFKEKYNLPFPLIADADKSINELYGVWVEKNMYGNVYMGTARTTFIIDEEGTIADIISKVNTENHTDQILKGEEEVAEKPVKSSEEKPAEVSSETVVEKSTTKAKKPAAKKAPVKKAAPAAKKPAAKKAATKKPAAKKVTAAKPAKKAVAKKKPATKAAAPKKAAAKKPAAKKTAVKKAVAKKAVAKAKPAAKKVAPKKTVAKKATTKNAAVKPKAKKEGKKKDKKKAGKKKK